MTIIIYSLANGNLRKRKTPDENAYFITVYFKICRGGFKYPPKSQRIWLMNIYIGWLYAFLYQRDCVITSNYAKRGIYHLSDAKMKEPQMPDFNSY